MWISVKEKLPEEWEKVLAFNPVALESIGIGYWFTRTDKEVGWCFNNVSGSEKYSPEIKWTHWIALPKSPKI